MHEGRLMKRFCSVKILLSVAIAFLVLSIVLSVVSLSPVDTNNSQTRVLVNDTFNMSPNEIYKQNLGSFWGIISQENRNISQLISLSVKSPEAFDKNFSIVTSSGLRFTNYTDKDIAYNFTPDAGYYEAVFANSTTAGTIHFTASIQEPKTVFPYFWLNEASKIIFLLSLGSVILIMLTIKWPKSTQSAGYKLAISVPKKTLHNCLIAFLVISLALWLTFLALNSNPWYTDHVRASYVSSLFLKDGFSIFNQPLGQLSSLDNSAYKFVTWPQMPHLYPLGSIFLFLPFGVLLQNGFNPVYIYKIEIAIFLVVSTVCLYFFLKTFIKKDLKGPEDKSRFHSLKILRVWLLKGLGIFIVYFTLMFYASNGMFDSVAILFCLFALSMFMVERYDYFFSFIMVAVFFKYQAGIFLLPLIIVGLMKLLQRVKLSNVLRNKAVIFGAVLGGVSIYTAYLSAPYVLATGPQLIMNGINAFSPNAQISWQLQSFAVLLTLAATLVYAFYMLNKNSLLSLSALFLLLPSFMFPYFQNWYFPFIFIYGLLPEQKKEVEATIIWLIFIISILYLGGAAFKPIEQILKSLTNL
jgi:hypothetical protein